MIPAGPPGPAPWAGPPPARPSAPSSARPPATPATGAWVGAAAGGVLGGVGGYLYAEHRNSEIRSSQAAAQANNYQGQGNVVSVDNVSASPSTVRPGQQVNLGMTYTILTPANTPVSVTLVREIRFNGQTGGVALPDHGVQCQRDAITIT